MQHIVAFTTYKQPQLANKKPLLTCFSAADARTEHAPTTNFKHGLLMNQ